MEKNYEQKKVDILKRFENKKTNFITNLFSLTKNLQEDLDNLSVQHREVEADEVEAKKSEEKESPKKTESKKK